MHAEALDAVYGTLSAALGRLGERDASLFLATLVLDLIASGDDGERVVEAIARAERLTQPDDATTQGL